MYFELSPLRKWVWFGRGRGLTRKGFNSKGLTQRFATPVKSCKPSCKLFVTMIHLCLIAFSFVMHMRQLGVEEKICDFGRQTYRSPTCYVLPGMTQTIVIQLMKT